MLNKLLKYCWPKRIKYQLILGVALVHAILMSTFVYDLVHREKTFLLNQIHQQTIALSETIASNSTEWVLSNNLSGLAEIMHSQLKYPNLSYAMIINAQGKILAHTVPEIVGQFVQDQNSLELLSSRQDLVTVYQSENIFDVATRIHIEGETLAWSRIALNTNTLHQNLQYISMEGVIYTVFAILVGSLFSWGLGNSLTRRIRSVVDATKEINPTLEQEIFTEIKPDEVGELMTNFNQMELKLNQQFKKIQSLAYKDPLTSLSNRTVFDVKFKEAQAIGVKNDDYSALVFIDVDRFKQLNDAYGHEKGDLLLIEMATRIRTFIREYDFAFRFGGDEFIIIFNALPDTLSKTDFGKLVREFLLFLNKTYDLGGLLYTSNFSIGVDFFKGQKVSKSKVLKRADIALRASKEAGQNQITFFKTIMETRLKERVEIEAALKNCLKNNEMFWMIQPQVDMTTGKTIGGEVLLRWKHNGNFIPPDIFIPFSEDTQTIIPISNWLIEDVFHFIQNSKLLNLPISINISPIHFFEKNLVVSLQALISKYQITPSQIKFEVTEGVFLKDLEQTVNILNQLKSIGFEISLDDFGTGFSSLSYLKNLPIDQLKIDKSFIDEAVGNKKSMAIVKSIINLTENLGVNVIAEGVETNDQRTFLIKNRCTHCQGYLYSKPLNPNEFMRYAI